MKKLLAILLALMLVMVSAFALATEPEPDVTDPTGQTQQGEPEEPNNNQGGGSGDLADYIDANIPSTQTDLNPSAGASATQPQVIEITKRINKDTYVAGDKHPALTPTFTVKDGTETMTNTVAVGGFEMKMKEEIAEDAGTGTIQISLPSYDKVGIYVYPVSENATNVAGIVEETQDMELKVTIIQKDDTLVIGGVAFRQEGTKTDEIDNLYRAGSLKVTKTVDGNLGDRTKAFPITITLTAPDGKTIESTITADKGTVTKAADKKKVTVTVSLAHNESIQIDNIPYDVKYTVAEDDAINHVATPRTEQENKDAYFVEGEVSDQTITAADIKNETIKNTKEIDIDTGVTLETTAYMLIMALTMAGFAMMMIRRRKEY